MGRIGTALPPPSLKGTPLRVITKSRVRIWRTGALNANGQGGDKVWRVGRLGSSHVPLGLSHYTCGQACHFLPSGLL